MILNRLGFVLMNNPMLDAEEPLGSLLNRPLMHRLFAHPVADRFDAADFRSALCAARLIPVREEQLWHAMFWFVAKKPAAA